MILSTLETCWIPPRTSKRGLGRVHQVVDDNILLSCCTSFRPSLTGNRFKMIQSKDVHHASEALEIILNRFPFKDYA